MKTTSIITQLNKWRHLPSFRLEPRVNVILSFYLCELLEDFTGKKIQPTIIPDFPVHFGTLNGDLSLKETLSKKVDFALFDEDKQTVYLFNVTTDNTSRWERRDGYLHLTTEKGFSSWLQSLVQTLLDTREKQEYMHLAHLLAKVGYLDIPREVYDCTFPSIKHGYAKAVNKIQVIPVADNVTIQFVDLHPRPSRYDVISFERFAEVLRRKDDPYRKSLADYLEQWRGHTGMDDPRDLYGS